MIILIKKNFCMIEKNIDFSSSSKLKIFHYNHAKGTSAIRLIGKHAVHKCKDETA